MSTDGRIDWTRGITSTGLILGCRRDTDLMTTMRGIGMNTGDVNSSYDEDAICD